jgi:putative serine protease PepD
VTAPGAGPGQDRSQDDGLFAAPWAARPRQEPATHEPATRTGTPAASSARGRALPIEDALRSPFAPPPADAPAPAAAPRGSFAPPATADASTAPPVHGAPPTTAPAPALTPADVLAVPVAQRAPASPLFASPTAPQAQPAPAPEHLVGTLDGLDLDLGADPADPAGTTDPADPWAPTDPAARRPRRRRRVPVALAATGLVLALVAGAVGGVLGERLLGDDRIADAGLPAAVGSGAGDRAPDSVAGIAAQVLPSVVSIEVTSAQGASTGSGVVLRQDGYILTNHHVVADAAGPGATVTALFADGSQEVATIVGSTADYDLAVIKVEVTGLTPLVLGDSDEVQVGDPVVAVGAPLGLAGTVTSGIVSALNGHPGVHQRDPDRRRDQPGQLRRSAGERGGRGDRDQLGHRAAAGRHQLGGRQHRPRLRDPVEPGPPHRGAADRDRQRDVSGDRRAAGQHVHGRGRAGAGRRPGRRRAGDPGRARRPGGDPGG